MWGDVLVGVLIGLACGVKINAVLIGLGLAWPLLRTTSGCASPGSTAGRRWRRSRLQYSHYGLRRAETDVRRAQAGHAALAVAGLRADRRRRSASRSEHHGHDHQLPVADRAVHRGLARSTGGSPPTSRREVVAPFALTFAWILVAPWVFAWYTAVAWAALTQVPRNRMTRWLTIVTVLLALCLSSGGHAVPTT